MSDQTPPPPPEQDPAGSAPPPASPYGAPAPPPPAAPTGPRPGELLDRFLARLIDYVILIVVAAIINTVLLVGVFGLRGGALGMGGSFTFAALSAVITTVIYLGYFAFMESNSGKTVGKMAMKLRVEGENGGKPTLEQAVKRNIWMALPLLGVVPIVGGLIGGLGELVAVILIAVGINNDPVRRQPWTDKFASTQVIKEG